MSPLGLLSAVFYVQYYRRIISISHQTYKSISPEYKILNLGICNSFPTYLSYRCRRISWNTIPNITDRVTTHHHPLYTPLTNNSNDNGGEVAPTFAASTKWICYEIFAGDRYLDSLLRIKYKINCDDIFCILVSFPGFTETYQLPFSRSIHYLRNLERWYIETGQM